MANMVRMGKMIDIWHSNCSAHVANLLSKDLLDQTLITNLTTVLKEFRFPDLEQAILQQGGTKIKLPTETRWCSYRDCCVCLKTNLKFMRQLIIDGHKIKANVKNLLFDDKFVDDFDKMITSLDPVSKLLNKVQSTDCTLAECAKLWLSLDGHDDQIVQQKIEHRTNQALNEYAITAYYLNPYCDQSKLNAEQKDVATTFLFENLDGQELLELDLFLSRKYYFAVCASKDLGENAVLFWRLCKLKYPSISGLANKLLNIPASSAQLERVFSNWGYIHSNVRNRLTFERSKKLLHIYYNAKINLPFKSDDEENIATPALP